MSMQRNNRQGYSRARVQGLTAVASVAVMLAFAAGASAETAAPTSTTTTPTTTSTTPTTSTPTATTTPTTSTPTTSTPTSTTPSPGTSPSGAEQYVEQVPTSTGSTPTSTGKRSASGVGTEVKSLNQVAPQLAPTQQAAAPKKHHHRHAQPAHAYTIQQAGDAKRQSAQPVAPASSAAPARGPENGNAHLIWLLAGIIAITALALGRFGYERRRASV